MAAKMTHFSYCINKPGAFGRSRCRFAALVGRATHLNVALGTATAASRECAQLGRRRTGFWKGAT